MRLIVLSGPQAVGKMTIGQNFCASYGFGLVHNHMLIDICTSVYGYGTPGFLDSRLHLTKAIINHALAEARDLVITKTFNFGSEKDRVEFELFRSFVDSAEVTFVELEAPLGVRLKRNKTRNRIFHKPSKANVSRSEKRLVRTSEFFEYFIPEDLRKGLSVKRLNTEDKSPHETSKEIWDYIS